MKKVIRLWGSMDMGLSLLLHSAGMGHWAGLMQSKKEQGQRERGCKHSSALLLGAHGTLLKQFIGFIQRM